MLVKEASKSPERVLFCTQWFKGKKSYTLSAINREKRNNRQDYWVKTKSYFAYVDL
jgi:hypothetical protein